MIISAIIALWRRNEADTVGMPQAVSPAKYPKSARKTGIYETPPMPEIPGLADYAKQKRLIVMLQERCAELEAETARLRRWNRAAWPHRRAAIVGRRGNNGYR